MFAADVEQVAAPLASRASRFLALLIDQAIGMGVVLLLKVVALNVAGVLVAAGLMTLNIIQIILVSTRGQTIGKLMMKVAIVDRIDKIPPGFVRAGLIRLAPLMAVNMFAPTLTLLYLVIDALPIFTSARRCVHDYLAGTIVIKLVSSVDPIRHV